MFSKDPFTISYSQAAMRSMALLEPNLVMPEILERAYSGLEVVNETHRTTAVMTMLSAVSLPLVTERIYLGGQKHVVPLLELCIPGIDLVCHYLLLHELYGLTTWVTERSYQDHLRYHVHLIRRATYQDHGCINASGRRRPDQRRPCGGRHGCR